MRSSVANSNRVSQQEGIPPSFYHTHTSTTQYTESTQKDATSVEGWFVLVLLAIAVYSVTFSVVAANWVDHSMVLLCSPIVGLLTGLAVAKTPRMPQSLLHLGACLLGHWLSIWLTSVLAFHISWLLLLGSLRSVIFGGLGAASDLPNNEMIIFFFYLSFLCFFLGYFGSWLIYRAHLPWLVAFVYCSIMLVNLNYVKQDLLFLFVVLVCALLLLIARTHLTSQITQWRREGLYTDRTWMRGITLRCMQAASVLTLVVILLSPLLPIVDQAQSGKVFWDRLDNIWTNILNGHISLQNPGALTQAYQAPTNFFGDQMTIAGSVHLPTGEVLNYTRSTGGPAYLEGFTYNQFDGHTWTSSVNKAESHSYGPNTPLPVDVSRNDTVQTTTTVTIVQPPESTKHYIFGPAQPSSFDVATTIYTDGNGSDETTNMWTQDSPLVVGERYQVISLEPPVVVTDSPYYKDVPLPADNTDFWTQYSNYDVLKLLYTQYPKDLSVNEQKTLAQWTQGAPNTYTALKMLESHLSDPNQFTYSLDNTTVPGNIDAVDWLLQTRKGYCTYYASAMSVMARQLGIPTRVVSGFSHGHFDAKRKVWVVQGDDAHSWVQAYLPTYGWVSFDPTPGFAPTTITKGSQPPPTVPPSPTKPVPTKTPVKTVSPPTTHPKNPTHPTSKKGATQAIPSINPSLLLWLSGIVLALSLLFFVIALGRYWWRNLYANSTFIAGMYWRFCYLARLLGLGPRTWQTPYEYSKALSGQVPQVEGAFRHLTDLFVRDRWAAPQQTPLPNEQEAAEHLWPSLWRMMGELFLRKIKR
jgi:transglutaminase-like putative cysteine protease